MENVSVEKQLEYIKKNILRYFSNKGYFHPREATIDAEALNQIFMSKGLIMVEIAFEELERENRMSEYMNEVFLAYREIVEKYTRDNCGDADAAKLEDHAY